MRIIAGKYKGTRLISPKTIKTRPTLDRVKEALFSILLPYIQNSKVLDLFAGTGALGIESISRGSSFALLNDKESSIILKNVQLTNCQKYVKITKKDYIKCLEQVELEDIKFNIIFLDPPYESEFAYKSLKYISDSKDKVLSDDGVVVYESDKNLMKNQDYEFDNLKCFDKRTYGRVLLRFYKWR